MQVERTGHQFPGDRHHLEARIEAKALADQRRWQPQLAQGHVHEFLQDLRRQHGVFAPRCCLISAIARRCFAGSSAESAYTKGFVSSRLRTAVGLLTIELPALKPAGRAEGGHLEVLQLGRQLRPAGELLEVVTNRLVQAFPHRAGGLARLLGDSFVDRQRDVHGISKGSVRTHYV